MSFSSGTFTLAAGNPVTTLTTISSSWANTTLSDIATGLSSCVLKDGTQTFTANLPMSGFKLTGLGAGAAAGDSLRYEQLFTTGTVSLLGALFVTAALNTSKAAAITATATVALGTMTGNYAVITGTNTITSFDSTAAGVLRVLEWSGITPLTNSANLILPGNANLSTATGDMSIAVSESAGTWRLMHDKRSGAPISMSPITTSLGSDVALNNTGLYFDGPSVAQGTVGTWFVSGTVGLTGSANDQISAKLWDGTTEIASGVTSIPPTTLFTSLSVSGFITAPAGNLRISCNDANNVTGKIVFNQSGRSKDSTITAIRIA